jgi:hypothetical protein
LQEKGVGTEMLGECEVILMDDIKTTALLTFCFMGMAAILLFMNQIMEVNAIRYAGLLFLGAATLLIVRIFYVSVKKKNKRN